MRLDLWPPRRRRGRSAVPLFAVGLTLLLGTPPARGQGPYDGPSGGIAAGNSLIQGWATGATIVRGPQNISTAGSPLATAGSAASAVGPQTNGNGVVSLGDGGSATLTFAAPITNGAGADFAVFENGFLSGGANNIFAELGHVEVSSDGINYVRFRSVSLTQTTTQVGSFGTIDATNVNNLAGKHVAGRGTPFDLQELAGNPLLDINAVTHVRVVDVAGSIDPLYGSRDSLGNLINDPFPTGFASGGFDLDAVAVMYFAPVPEPTTLGLVATVGLVTVRAVRRHHASRKETP